MFAGSILNLEPDTDYECRLVLSDPDGVSGIDGQNRHRAHPQGTPPAAGGHVYHVYPFGFKGTRQQPAFTGLLAAYYLGFGSVRPLTRCRRVCSRATRFWCMPVSTRTTASSTAALTASIAAYGTPLTAPTT